ITCHVRYEWSSIEEFLKAWTTLTGLGKVSGEPPTALVKTVRATMAMRDSELDVLAQWTEKLGESMPWVISGDLNIDDEASQVRRLQGGLRATSALQHKGVAGRTWAPAVNPNISRSSSYTHVDGAAKDLGDLVVAYHDQLAQRPDHVFLDPRFSKEQLVDARI